MLLQIGKMRYVKVSCFKGKVLVDIREFYTDKEGSMKPGRKGTTVFTGRWQGCSEKQCRKLLCRALVPPLSTSPFSGCWQGQSCKVEKGRLSALALMLFPCVLMVANTLVFWYW